MQFKQLTAFVLLSLTFFVSAAPVTTPGHLPGVPGVQNGSHKGSAERRDVNDQKHGHHKVRGELDREPHVGDHKNPRELPDVKPKVKHGKRSEGTQEPADKVDEHKHHARDLEHVPHANGDHPHRRSDDNADKYKHHARDSEHAPHANGDHPHRRSDDNANKHKHHARDSEHAPHANGDHPHRRSDGRTDSHHHDARAVPHSEPNHAELPHPRSDEKHHDPAVPVHQRSVDSHESHHHERRSVGDDLRKPDDGAKPHRRSTDRESPVHGGPVHLARSLPEHFKPHVDDSSINKRSAGHGGHEDGGKHARSAHGPKDGIAKPVGN